MKFSSHLFRRMQTAWRILRFMLIAMMGLFLVGGSVITPSGLNSLVRAYTRPIEFDFGTWTLDAMAAKFSAWGLSLERFLSPESQRRIVFDYLDQVNTVQQLNVELVLLYADPTIKNPEEASQSLREELASEEERLSDLAPLAEAVLQTQLMDIIRDVGLSGLGQVFPPSLYQTSDIPYSLIVSPRTEIRQALDISLSPGINADVMDELEMIVLNDLDYAALVVPIGGIGTYPTMVMQTTDLVWLTEVISHEWVHNFLTLRPLGLNYYTNAELRTINETTASLAGKELGLLILQRYYPEFVPVEIEMSDVDTSSISIETDMELFDFQAEMRITRVEVDRLLMDGEVDEAEAYMAARREFFWDNGYTIRKLNQAYFAFYGAYNDVPGGGASGEDPVGPAVVAFRAQYDSLANFLRAISWVDSFDELLSLLEE